MPSRDAARDWRPHRSSGARAPATAEHEHGDADEKDDDAQDDRASAPLVRRHDRRDHREDAESHEPRCEVLQKRHEDSSESAESVPEGDGVTHVAGDITYVVRHLTQRVFREDDVADVPSDLAADVAAHGTADRSAHKGRRATCRTGSRAQRRSRSSPAKLEPRPSDVLTDPHALLVVVDQSEGGAASTGDVRPGQGEPSRSVGTTARGGRAPR